MKKVFHALLRAPLAIIFRNTHACMWGIRMIGRIAGSESSVKAEVRDRFRAR